MNQDRPALPTGRMFALFALAWYVPFGVGAAQKIVSLRSPVAEEHTRHAAIASGVALTAPRTGARPAERRAFRPPASARS